jgi:hypothetical protein
MKFSSSLNWFRRLIVLGAVIAGATAASAGAMVPTDGGGSTAVQGSTALGLKADGMRLQGIAQVYKSLSNDSFPTAQGLRAEGQRLTGIAHVYQTLQPVAVPDVLERYAAAHPYGAGTAAAVGTERIVDDSFRDPTPIATPAGDRIVDDSFRDPAPIVTPAGDRLVDDYFRDAPTVVASPTSGNGLDWEDFGIGAGAMLGLGLLATCLGLGAVAMRHRAGKLGTS